MPGRGEIARSPGGGRAISHRVFLGLKRVATSSDRLVGPDALSVRAGEGDLSCLASTS